jgi:hypothetical protein
MQTHDHDFVECPFCGSNRAVLMGVEDDGLHEGFACPDGCPQQGRHEKL